jgi:hypothetical protein
MSGTVFIARRGKSSHQTAAKSKLNFVGALWRAGSILQPELRAGVAPSASPENFFRGPKSKARKM